MIRILTLGLAVGCSPKIDVAPDRAGCTQVVTTDVGDDGSIETTQTREYDEQGRVAVFTSDGFDGDTLEQRWSYDDAGCRVGYEYRQVTGSGDVYTSLVDSTCDANQEFLTEVVVDIATGSYSYQAEQENVWDRTYDANGRTSSAVLTATYVDFGFSFDTLLSYVYDDRGRLLESVEESDYGVDRLTQIWVDDLDTEADLLASRELRDGLGLLVDGRYLTYDERGRIVRERTVDARRVDLEVETVWEKKGWVPVEFTYRSGGEVTQRATATTDGDDPYQTIELAFDGYDSDPDGTVDARTRTVWTCP